MNPQCFITIKLLFFITIGYNSAVAQTTQDVTKRQICDEELHSQVNGRLECTSKIIFNENFNVFDHRKWQAEVRFASEDKHEFVMYDNKSENIFIKDGVLHLRPTLLDQAYGQDYVYTGAVKLDAFPSRCTNPVGNSACSKTADKGFRILPPIVSGRIRTYNSFRFRYGTIEIKAKMPAGDWIWPQLMLIPRNHKYAINPVEIILAAARGNRDLFHPEDNSRKINFGSKWLEAGVILGKYNPKTNPHMFAQVDREGGWNKKFHTYTLEWTPDSLTYKVDGHKIGVGELKAPKDGFIPNVPNKFAPFDDEFFIVLGVGVGGVEHFPDGFLTKAGHPKPWKNTSPKAMLKFWQDKGNWYPTWKGDESALQIASVKVTSIEGQT